MRARTRMVLPLAQLAIAAALTISNLLRPDTAASHSWAAPDRQFCLALNAPVALIVGWLVRGAYAWASFPWNYRIAFALERVIFFVLVGLLWYGVSTEIDGRGQSVITPKTGMRSVADMLAMLLGLGLVPLGLYVRRVLGYHSMYGYSAAMLYFAWAATVVVFYGHDLWACSRTLRRKPTGEDHDC